MTLARECLVGLILCLGQAARAQVTNTEMAIADAFLCTGSPNRLGNPVEPVQLAARHWIVQSACCRLVAQIPHKNARIRNQRFHQGPDIC